MSTVPIDGQPRQYTISQIEAAVNYWRIAESSGSCTSEILLLGKHARIIADIYGLMIFERKTIVNAASLSQAQIDAIAQAVGDLPS